jgi:hypothetical protein
VGDELATTARRFHGLFIGINRYTSREVRRLASAVRDVTALHAVFTDNLGGTSTLLVDADATRSAILAALDDLRHRSTDDDVSPWGRSSLPTARPPESAAACRVVSASQRLDDRWPFRGLAAPQRHPPSRLDQWADGCAKASPDGKLS